MKSTVQSAVSIDSMPVARLTPVPSRWKLWLSALSFTWMPYVPAATELTTVPSPVFSKISKPGPTLASRLPMNSACEFEVVKRETTLAAKTASATTTIMRDSFDKARTRARTA